MYSARQIHDAEISYGISVQRFGDDAVEVLRSDNQVFETASAIKAPISALACLKAAESGLDFNETVLELDFSDAETAHTSNGSGVLKNLDYKMPGVLQSDERRRGGTAEATLAAISMLSIQNSDCVATNALIDFLGDKGGVNKRLEWAGLAGMELITDRLRFPGVDHTQTPFQVGKSTTDALASFYAMLGANSLDLPEKLHGDLLDDLSQVARTHFFDCDVSELPETVRWRHKTGSIIDEKPDAEAPFYITLVDAGILDMPEGRFSVAAATTIFRRRKGVNASLAQVAKTDFAARNLQVLSDCGISVQPTCEAA